GQSVLKLKKGRRLNPYPHFTTFTTDGDFRMTHIITSICLRDGACVEVCPVECIIPGLPENEWPWYFIDPDTCIDCGACIPECPYEAIFPEEEVPQAYELAADQERIPFRGDRYKAAGG